MERPYKPKITQGAGERFSPACNIAQPSQVSSSLPTCAEVAEQAMKKHAAQRADDAAYERAKAAQATARNDQPRRWLKASDLK
jgi:hypothetical protein